MIIASTLCLCLRGGALKLLHLDHPPGLGRELFFSHPPFGKGGEDFHIPILQLLHYFVKKGVANWL